MKSPTVNDNAKLLTVAACYEHMERLDGLIRLRGPLQRYTEARGFFERELQNCLKRREASHHEHHERSSRATAR
jgi:hypothetical protein